VHQSVAVGAEGQQFREFGLNGSGVVQRVDMVDFNNWAAGFEWHADNGECACGALIAILGESLVSAFLVPVSLAALCLLEQSFDHRSVVTGLGRLAYNLEAQLLQEPISLAAAV
jgi:hypothetical protein